MFEKYRGLLIACLVVGAVLVIGLRPEKNNNKNIHKIVEKVSGEANTAELEEGLATKFKDSNHEDNSNLTPSQVEEIVKSYLIKNPQVVADALESLQRIRMEEMNKQVQGQIEANKSSLEASSAPIIGNPKGSSIVVMFYDYNCGYCKQSAEAIEELIRSNNDVKVIFKVYPILGAESEYLAKIVLALNQTAPHKFKAIHDELISNKTFNKEDLVKLFKDNGLDFTKIEALSETKEIEDQLKETIKLARELRINGVPAFIINGNYFPGFLTTEQLTEKVKK